MRIALLTMGTFGDVRPFLALTYGLEERGHQVTLSGPDNFVDYVGAEYNRSYLPNGIDSQQVLESEQGRRWMASGNAKQFLKEMGKISHERRYEVERYAMEACTDCDIIIAHPLQLYYACSLSEKLNKPLIIASPFPMSPSTTAFPHFLATSKIQPFGFMNKATYRLVGHVYERSVRQDMNEWRAKLELAPLRGTVYRKLEQQKIPFLQAFSPALLAPPTDWGDQVVVTGQWKVSDEYVPSQEKAALTQELSEWLHQGTPPIYFGFGSLPVLEPQKMIDMAVHIASTLRSRAIIASGWSSMDIGGRALPDTVKMITFANHDILFPQCSVIVHHGGAGTTHTAAESGTPAVICSTYADQPFWGECIERKGIGKHLPFSRLTEEKLLQAIRELMTPSVRAKAASVAQQLQAESGLQTALDWLERNMPTAPVYRN